MENKNYQQIRNDAQNLAPVSVEALEIFNQNFAKLLALVNEKFALETKFFEEDTCCGQIQIVKNVQKHFGELLLSVYEFQLFANLIDEFIWYISMLSSRGFEKKHFGKMLKAWTIAIQSAIRPPQSHELVRPLEFLYQNLHQLHDTQSSVEDQKTGQVAKLKDFLLRKKRKEAAEYMLSLLREGLSIETLCSNIITVTLEEIGTLWQKNRINVVDQHIATDICQYVVYRLLDSIFTEVQLPFKAIVSCVPGEEHEMGAEILESYLAFKGWQVSFMGHIAPQEDIIKAISTDRPDVVFLSVCLIANLPSAKALIMQVRKVLPEVNIIVGGRAAMLAREAVEHFSNAVVDSFYKAHTRALQLAGAHA